MNGISAVLKACLSLGDSEDHFLRSPADVFAICGYLAKSHGFYRVYSESGIFKRERVLNAVEDASAWKTVLDKAPMRHDELPFRVAESWKCVVRFIEDGIAPVPIDVVISCLHLIICADEIHAGVGLPGGKGTTFEVRADLQLNLGTLCRIVPSEFVRVLPKQHVPQSGFNMRSLTHHLALFTSNEVRPIWTQLPKPVASRRASYNVLVAPWPLTMRASDICTSVPMEEDAKFGYFDYLPSPAIGKAVVDWTETILRNAKSLGQPVDLLVFPECALDEEEWDSVAAVAAKEGAFIVAGVRGRNDAGNRSTNVVRLRAPFKWQESEPQHKHHRWKLNRSQITSYGLGGTLQSAAEWWENIDVRERTLNFFAMSEDLVICPLICEDLARQDPVAELVRSVGPNLVVALLMDGPQLPQRWSARYASVLADDPGSSVLTVTSLGMVKLSKPVGLPSKKIVASWRDAFGDFVPIELHERDEAVILNLQFRRNEERSVDGRSDEGAASYPILCGIHPISSGELRS